MTRVYRIDPLKDPRWEEFLQRHPHSSVFHTRGWLEALRCTYDYQPFVYTTCSPGAELRNGLPFCRIDSFLTGRRLVSVPFADHCEPLVDSADDWKEILTFLQDHSKKENWKYIEIRPRSSDWSPGTEFQRSEIFYFHTLDLHPDAQELLRGCQKGSVQRKIRRAEREGLTYEEGRSDTLLQEFYRLLLLTRRRHQLPPQPREWFRNLMTCLGNQAKIRVVSKDGQPIASIVTFRHKNTLVYKYGCSDSRFHNLGGMPLLFWKAIQEAKQEGLLEFDFGRSNSHQPGLIAFKDHWGTTRSTLTYQRYPARYAHLAHEDYRLQQLAKRVFACVPDGILAGAGRLLYKHIG